MGSFRLIWLEICNYLDPDKSEVKALFYEYATNEELIKLTQEINSLAISKINNNRRLSYNEFLDEIKDCEFMEKLMLKLCNA